jgi:DNA gyrase subunit B
MTDVTDQSVPAEGGAAEYGASSITVLEGLEAVRKRPGMYIGSTGERGLHHLVQEIVDNAVDEAMAGYCDTITVVLQEDGGVRVEDNGRGIPVEMHPKEGVPAVQVVFTTLHAGGKFDSQAYAVSGGLHGVGSAVVNALSTRLDVVVYREGRVHRQSFVQAVARPIETGEPTDRTGTTVTFWADPTIFTETTTYTRETIAVRPSRMSLPTRLASFSLRWPLARAHTLTTLVSAARKPSSCVPPSCVLIVFANV